MQQRTADGAVAREDSTATPTGPRRYLAICDNDADDEDEMDFEEGDVSTVKGNTHRMYLLAWLTIILF